MVKQDLFQLFLLALNLKKYVNNASVLKIKKKKTSNTEHDWIPINWICCNNIKVDSLKATLLSYYDFIYQ